MTKEQRKAKLDEAKRLLDELGLLYVFVGQKS